MTCIVRLPAVCSVAWMVSQGVLWGSALLHQGPSAATHQSSSAANLPTVCAATAASASSMQCLSNWLGVPSTHIRSSALPSVTPSLAAAASWHRTITQAAKQEQPRTPKQPKPPKVGHRINAAVCSGTKDIHLVHYPAGCTIVSPLLGCQGCPYSSQNLAGLECNT
jgi:hypothetical protein